MAGALEITRERRTNELELKVSGRLDGYWANHLADAIRDVLREGVHHLRLNLSQTSYLSSAGIRVLVEAYKEFAGIDGSFVVVHPSPGVKQVLDLAGMGPLLCSQAGSAAAAAAAPEREAEREEVDGAVFETYAYEASATLACRATGRPEKLANAAFAEDGCEVLSLGRDVFALGLGALGDGFSACRERFGEFLSLAGNAACQPTDNTNYPDYLVTSGSLIPHVVALYSVACRGGFQKLMRFEGPASGAPVGFSALLTQVRRQFEGRAIGMVLLAESAGLLGASLRRPPVAGGESARVFQHPEIRKWISFSPERAYTRSVAVIAGIASDSPSPEISHLLRPMTPDGAVMGHFHAAAFGYHPLQKGRIDLATTVSKLFDTGGLQGVLHLLCDDRPASGAGESEFLRGACWFGPIDRFVTAGETL